VFKFIHIYATRIRGTGGIGVFTVDSVSHDPRTLNTIKSEFDGVLELQDSDAGEREIRGMGISGTSRQGRDFD
jgi:hypothetical protein